jgi:leucyl-tRNA synthetase
MSISFEKMSKSKGNGVAPDTMAEKYGVDTLRLVLMFGGPPESDLNFDENFLVSMKSFLDKVAKSADNILKKFNKTNHKQQIQNEHKDKLIPIYELLADYDQKINV